MSTAFRERLILRRAAVGWTQQELAHRAKVPSMVISHYETGHREPSIHNLMKIAIALNVTTDFLLGMPHAY